MGRTRKKRMVYTKSLPLVQVSDLNFLFLTTLPVNKDLNLKINF